jgi:hypothetical protein
MACRLFFEADLLACEEHPEAAVAHHHAAIGELRGDRPQGEVRLLRDPRQQP